MARKVTLLDLLADIDDRLSAIERVIERMGGPDARLGSRLPPGSYQAEGREQAGLDPARPSPTAGLR